MYIVLCRPFYGYHEKEHLFFKIYFYNPAIIKRTADLLQVNSSALLHMKYKCDGAICHFKEKVLNHKK